MTKVVCLVLILLQNLVHAQYYQSCVTPNRANGLCQPIRTCASVLALLQQPLTEETRRFLRSSQCRVDTDPWVCCPASSVSTATPKPETSVNTAATSKLPKAPNCGIDSPNRIFGGEDTKIDEFPWLVQLQYTKPGNKKGFHCGGSLINQRYVLTAAHCIKKVPATWKLTSVRLGEWDTTTDNDCDDSFTNERVCNDPHVDIPVEEEIVHESYHASTKDQHDDIALLRLSRNVRYTEFIKPICLPWDSNLQSVDLSGMSLDVAGWGKTETSSASTRKQKVAVSAYTNSRCQGVYSSSSIKILDNQICAGGESGKDSCNGDSGGPLMRYHERGSTPHYFLAGIVSYGPRNCGTRDIPGVYTRVSKYANWIESNIRA